MNQPEKIRKISFTRNPKFTPDLPTSWLDRIEELAYQTVEAVCKCNPNQGARKFHDDLDLWSYLNPDFCAFYGVDVDREKVFADERVAKYLLSSVNFLLVVAQKKGYMIFGQYQHSYKAVGGYDIYW